MKIYNIFLDLIAPKNCLCCNKQGYFLCKNCHSKIEPFSEICYVCKKHSNNFLVHEGCKIEVYYDKVFILNHYRNFYIKKLIKSWKFYNKKEVFYDFSLYFLKLLNKENINDFFITSIPSHFTRKLIRWYNSSEVLARYFSDISWLTYKSIIYKNKYTKQQSKLSKKERQSNLKWTFSINKKYKDIIKWRNFIIIDDVISTGSTINEVSKILKENWADKIYALIVASD